MKLRALLVVLVGFACAGACSLNPQPLPPGSYDASSFDASKADDANQLNGEGGEPPPEDAGVDAPANAPDGGDAAVDADATTDAASDAPDDAPDGD